MTKKGENPVRRSQRKRGRPALESNSVTSPEVNNNSPNMNKSFVVISSNNTDSYFHVKMDPPPAINEMLHVKKQGCNVDDRLNAMEASIQQVMQSVGWLTQTLINQSTKTPVTPELTASPSANAAVDQILKKFGQPCDKGTPIENPEKHTMNAGTPEEMTPITENPNALVRKLFTTPKTVLPDFVPPFLKKIFTPEATLLIPYPEIAVALYIFKKSNKEDSAWKEMLVRSEIPIIDGTRGMLQSLRPKEAVGQDVINMLVCLLTATEKARMKNPPYWFFPTTFSQAVLRWNTHPDTMKRSNQKHFMGSIDLVRQVFIPVNDDNKHWYLLVVDFTKQQVKYLDSCPDENRMAARIRQTKLLTIYLDELLQDVSFYDFELTPKPVVSSFKLVIPEEVRVEKPDSNDCGVWVATWMERGEVNKYDNIEVSNYTRLSLAAKIGLHSYNLLQGMVLTKSLDYYHRLLEADKKKKAVPRTC